MSERTVVEVYPLTKASGAAVPDCFIVGFADGTTLKTTTSVIAAHHLHTGRVLTEADYAAVLDTLGWREAYDEKAGRPWEALPADIETLS